MILIIVVIYCLNFTEGFEEDIPDYCGSAGYTPSQAMLNISGMKMNEADRQYTQSECDKIDDAKFKYGICSIVKDGKTIDLDILCKGLNKIPSLPPAECSVDGKLLGITNKLFKLKGDRTITFPENSVRLYTEKECDKLNGKHDITSLTMMNKTEREEFIKNHGKGYGVCKDKSIDYSLMCYAEPPSLTDVKNKLSSLLS